MKVKQSAVLDKIEEEDLEESVRKPPEPSEGKSKSEVVIGSIGSGQVSNNNPIKSELSNLMA